MKTPRDLLVERSRRIEARLDEARSRALEPLRTAASENGEGPLREGGGGFIWILWDRLIRPWRVQWGALAFLWAVSLVLHTLTFQPSSGSAFPPTAAAPEELLREQRMLRAELMADPEVEHEPAPEKKSSSRLDERHFT